MCPQAQMCLPGLWRGVGNMPLGYLCCWEGCRCLKLAFCSPTAPGDSTVGRRRKPVCLSAPIRRKEEFSLFKVSDDEYKVKISPQLLLATQRFLSRGEGGGRAWVLLPCSLQWVRRPQGRHRRLPFPMSRRVSGDPVLLQPCQQRHSWTLSGHLRGPGWCYLCEPWLVGTCGCLVALVLGRGLSSWTSREHQGGHQESVR